MKTHLMLDFETLGNTPNTVVLSLGAVLFTKEKIIAGEHWFLNPEDQLRAKLDVNFETICWWMEQGVEAKTLFKVCATEGLGMKPFLDEFEVFLKTYAQNTDCILWANGANFDIPIMENLFRRAGKRIPWRFFNTRCYRTVKAIHKIEDGTKRNGIKHNALDDAMYQASCVMGMFEKIPGSDL